ncbi:hypothetical protein AMTRI_Chr02g258560 [Amborella trichopoda]
MATTMKKTLTMNTNKPHYLKPITIQTFSICCCNQLVSRPITYKDVVLFGDLKKCAFQVQSKIINMSLRHIVLVNRGKQSQSSRKLHS